MFDESNSPILTAVASQLGREEEYWLAKFSGELVKTAFPHDQYLGGSTDRRMETFLFSIEGRLLEQILKLSNGSNPKIHIILIAALLVLLYKYTGNTDVIIGTPIYKQEIEGEFINTVLALRNQLAERMTFKELLLQVRNALREADENQNYPIKALVDKLELPIEEGGIPLFDTAILLENIQERKYIRHIPLNILFSFKRVEKSLEGSIEFNKAFFRAAAIERMANRYCQLLESVLENVESGLSEINIITAEERRQLLMDFNRTESEKTFTQPLHRIFDEQSAKSPDRIALVVQGPNFGTKILSNSGNMHLSYDGLNKKSNRLARWLTGKGVSLESVVGIMVEPSLEMITALMAALKAGGAYLPIDPGMPEERILYMLNEAGVSQILTKTQALKGVSFTALQNFASRSEVPIRVTPVRSHIEEFDRLPRPDRSLINLRNYKNKIGMASVTNCISLQATRGCPYHCLYCHKIWSKHHIYRSAENIFAEIEYYYRNGVTNFAFIDDCFNLNQEKSSRVFESICKNKLKVQLFFPNGLRGDIMTPDYIDLMAEAGTRGINLSLETASPRLQKLLKKHLDLDKFKKVLDYIAAHHPEIILEMASMHGFPSETEEEAMMTLDFIKSIKWLHFPYIHILKIFPNTEMEAFALEHGVSRRDIVISKDRAFHELPETLPFPKSFTRKYQADFLNNYFLNKERLIHVLPRQMNILTETALVQKYNAYLPTEIKSIQDIIRFAQLEDVEIPEGYGREEERGESIFDRPLEIKGIKPGARRILLLDLSQHFSSHQMLYRVVEQPLGLISLLTYLKETYGDKIDGRIYKSGNDFDSYEELAVLVKEYQPELVGIRTLTFFREFFHETVSLLRQWGVTVPVITGGPYASSDYDTILKDENVDLVVFGEGEYTLAQLIGEMLKNDFRLPEKEVLDSIAGIAYAQDTHIPISTGTRDVIQLDRLLNHEVVLDQNPENPGNISKEHNLAYVMYTSGSTGKPKGVMVEHRQVNTCISWMQETFQLDQTSVIINRTDLTFDPSVWEIFWPLYIGGGVRLLDTYQRKDAEFLIRLMAGEPQATMMYCPATLVNIMTYLLNTKREKLSLKLPWLIIGAEPITMEVVKNFYRYYTGRIFNTYGPTECTINNTYYDIDPDDERALVPIGKPVANNKIFILDRELQPVPLKIPGEICIAGDSIARGYIGNREQTEQFFIPNPFGEGKLYRTGDIGRWLEDGNIEIMGRIDEQVKIRGYRIELGEIETRLTAHPLVNECLVVVRDSSQAQEETQSCVTCGITTRYPNVSINANGICNICDIYSRHKQFIDTYFKFPGDIKDTITEANKHKQSSYDCLLLYAGGRGAAYALYRLVDMGFKVLAATYDNGYFGKADIENIKKMTASLGVDHVVLTHPHSDQIMRESIKIASTVCRGCFHTSSSLAAEYAYKHNINVVVGATLSRGQIIENKLLMFLQQGITAENELEREIAQMQRSAPEIDKTIFKYIDIDVVNDGSVYENVKFLDFYRYFDIGNNEMITYLNNRDPYWQSRKNYAIYSTNCPIKQIGDFGHLLERDFHYYGGATSWELRLGHLTMENLHQDLTCNVSKKGYERFLQRIKFQGNHRHENGEKYLCAYFVPSQEGEHRENLESELRGHLARELPAYMIPTYFESLDKIPLSANGKVDKKALPEPKRSRTRSSATYVAPKSNLEITIAETWKEVLTVDLVGTEDNFFDLGGNSLDIIMVGSKLKELLNRDIATVALFTYPTIQSLALHLGQEELGIKSQLEKKDRGATLNEGKNIMKLAIKKMEGGR